jgi:hypothetical protein
MRHRVFYLGLTVVSVMAAAIGCAGDDGEQPQVSPADSSFGGTSSAVPTGTGTSTSLASTSPSGNTSSGNTSSATSTAPTTSDMTSQAPAGPSFATDIHPIFVGKCVGPTCHGDGSFFGSFGATAAATAFTAASNKIEAIESRVLTGQMPVDASLVRICETATQMHDTSRAECLSADELAKLEAWIEAGGPA